jgi:hypothetical protein
MAGWPSCISYLAVLNCHRSGTRSQPGEHSPTLRLGPAEMPQKGQRKAGNTALTRYPGVVSALTVSTVAQTR